MQAGDGAAIAGLGDGMNDMSPAQQGALLMSRLLLHGPINAEDEARRMGVSRATMYRLLDDLSALHRVPVANDRGWWFVNLLEPTDYEDARRMLALVSDELAQTPPGTLYCRAFKRRDMMTMEHLLQCLTAREPVTP